MDILTSNKKSVYLVLVEKVSIPFCMCSTYTSEVRLLKIIIMHVCIILKRRNDCYL